MTGSAKWRALFEELEAAPGRWRRAARVGLITALGAGMTAAMQIANPLGLTLLFNFALPEAAFSPARGAAFLCCAAVFQVFGLMLVGALVNSPVVHVAVFILICFCTTYLIYAVPTLGRLWVWIQVPVVTAFYLVLFLPDQLGWDAAQAFAGMAVAVAVLLLCNSIVRPEPAESVLSDSIAATLTRSRLRLARLIEISLGEAAAADDRPVGSRLGYHLSLLAPAIASASSAARSAALLAHVTIAEAIRGQTERLAAVVLGSRGGRHSPAAAAAELRALAAALDSRLKRYASDLLRGRAQRAVDAPGAAPQETPPALAPADTDRIARLGAEVPELARIAAPIARINELLENDRIELPSEETEIDVPARPPPAVVRNFLIRFSARHTLALTAAFLIGVWDNYPALHAAIWVLMLGGPPSHGATVRKFTMRAIGASGALALAALGTIVVAPNFTSPGPYMAAIFVGTLLMAYIGEGGGILSYLAIGGTAFVIGYGGPGPRADVLGSIWSIWGISLGMIIRAAISLLWRERASRTLAEQFQAPLAAMLELVKEDGDDESRRRRVAAEKSAVTGIAMMLGVANDSMLEGHGAEIDSDQLVNALDTLRRLAFALGNLARVGPAGTAISTNVSTELTDAIRVRLESWLCSLRDQTDSGVASRAPLRKMIAEANAPDLRLLPADERTASPGIEISYGTADERVILLTQTLERQLAAVSRSRLT
jgi:hypothetical protein